MPLPFNYGNSGSYGNFGNWRFSLVVALLRCDLYGKDLDFGFLRASVVDVDLVAAQCRIAAIPETLRSPMPPPAKTYAMWMGPCVAWFQQSTQAVIMLLISTSFPFPGT